MLLLSFFKVHACSVKVVCRVLQTDVIDVLSDNTVDFFPLFV